MKRFVRPVLDTLWSIALTFGLGSVIYLTVLFGPTWLRLASLLVAAAIVVASLVKAMQSWMDAITTR